MVKGKYWVPALERAHYVLELIAECPGKLKMTDIASRLGISKSTMFSLLQTMEKLHWITKDESDTYRLGIHYGMLGNAFFSQFDLIDYFKKEAVRVRDEVNESVQMAVLEGDHIVYMAKLDAPTPVQMVSGPGVKFPAHATGLGKALLASLGEDQLNMLYPDPNLPPVTPHTITSRDQLFSELETIREQGYAEDREEGVIGFCCVAAAVNAAGSPLHAAVSVSMPTHHWEEKGSTAVHEVRHLAKRLSFEHAKRLSYEHLKEENQWL